VLGPLKAHRWRFDDPGCPWPITAELWIRADRKRMMEMSIKAPAAQAAVAVGGFMAFLAEVGAERDNEAADQDPLGALVLRRQAREGTSRPEARAGWRAPEAGAGIREAETQPGRQGHQVQEARVGTAAKRSAKGVRKGR